MKRLGLSFLTIIMSLLAVQAMGDVRKEVSIWVARDVAPGPKVRLTINTRNVPIVRMAAYKLNDISILIGRESLTKRPAIKGKPVQSWDVNLVTARESKGQAQRDAYRDRQVNLPPLSPGIYLLTAEGGDKEAWAIVNVTNLAIVVKRSPRRILTWVTDAKSGKVISGAAVKLYGDNTKALRSNTTKSDGISIIEAPAELGQTVIVTKGDDLAFTISTTSSGDGILKSHFQTDRPVYRPGQTVFYKAILRRTNGRGYDAVKNTPCSVALRDPEDNVLEEVKLSTNSIGTLTGQFDIPSEAAIGAYTIRVSMGEESVYETISVAEYRKPEFKVGVQPVKKRYLAGEDVAFVVDSSYYFGAPLQQASVSYKIRRSGMSYWGSDPSWWASDDGNLYPRDTYRSNDFVAEGTVYTDDTGKVAIPVKTKIGMPDSTYSIECTVQDASRRRVDGSASVPVYAAPIRVGIRTDVYSAPLGSNIPVQIQVVDLDGKPTSAKVTLDIQGYVWDRTAKEYKIKSFVQTVVDVPASGKAAAKVPAKTEGDVTIMATAEKAGRKTTASLSLWVAGSSSKIEKEAANKEPAISTRLDKHAYTPGDTVKAWITTNTLDRPLLITLEGLDIWQYAVLPAGKSVRSWSVKTSVEMSPNVHLDVSQWAKNTMVSGGESVQIPDPTCKLEVKIEPGRNSYRPGETASYVIRTTSQDGKPVPAEVAVAVVDESIYAIRADSTPDLYNTFWSNKPNRVTTSCSAPEEVSGGAYQNANSMAPTRQRFVDTAFWNAQVMTDKDGVAEISFETPGNLTTWRVGARAITADTKVGTAVTTTQASRPVMLRLATPRQFVLGDRLTLIGRVNNRTSASHRFETAISAVGLRVDGDTTKKIQVAAGAEGSVEWTLMADSLPQSGFASITGRTLATDAAPDQGEELSDALKVDVRVVPNGIQHRFTEGGAMAEVKTVSIDLPADRIEPASVVRVSVKAGLAQVVADMAASVVESGRYCSLDAADQLLAISISGLSMYPRDTREALAAIYNRQMPDRGWGWWAGESDPEITAAVLTDLVRARARKMPVPDRVIERGSSAAALLFNEETLWERAAQLASAATLAGYKDSTRLLEKVHEKGKPLSPFAQLSLAEAYLKAGKRDWAEDMTRQTLKNAVVGPEVAYVPAGDHPGWSATNVETTAQALLVLTELPINADLGPKLAQWLVGEDSHSWLSQHEMAVSAFALSAYSQKHPQSTQLGTLSVSVNGTALPPAQQKNKTVQVMVPVNLLKNGANEFKLSRNEPGEVFYSIDARVYQPVTEESHGGMRVMRRYEVRNAAGLWDEMQGSIKPSEPVRCTVIVWPNDRPDCIRLVEPIPSGFEFADSDYTGYYGREEVRDGAVVHYLRSSGDPVFFRYYLRPESEGTFVALPAMAEAVRRPWVRGNSEVTHFEVKK